MAVDLAAYLDNLKREVNPPGINLDASATDDELIGHLTDAYWQAVIDGIDYLKTNFNGPDLGASGGTLVTPISPSGPDLPRELVQLVILYASITIIRNRMLNLKTQYSAAAGSAKIEFQQSAAMFRAIFDDLNKRRGIILRRLSDVGIIPTITMDKLSDNDYQLFNREIFWERA